MSKSRTIAIDFDGVIHAYSKGWQDGSIYDDPLPGAIEFLDKVLTEQEYSIFILSTRDSKEIGEWLFSKGLNKHEIFLDNGNTRFWNKKGELLITSRKLPANIYIDDRGLKFEGTFEGLEEQVKQFNTWQGAN